MTMPLSFPHHGNRLAEGVGWLPDQYGQGLGGKMPKVEPAFEVESVRAMQTGQPHEGLGDEIVHNGYELG